MYLSCVVSVSVSHTEARHRLVLPKCTFAIMPILQMTVQGVRPRMWLLLGLSRVAHV